MTTRPLTRPAPLGSPSALLRRMRHMLITGSVTLFAVMLLAAYLQPVSFMIVGSLQTTQDYFASPNQPLLPVAQAVYVHEGAEYPLYEVPTDANLEVWALVQKGRKESVFVDPLDPERGLIYWSGSWRSLNAVWLLQPQWQNFPRAWQEIRLGFLIRNSLIIAIVGTLASILSSLPVAYGFARFRIPGKQILFLAMLGTMMMPPQITLISSYMMYDQLGWVGTWLPLLVPRFFASAFNVFLLRQVFLTVSREIDEAAMLDGAGPLRTLFSVVVPSVWPAVVTVTLLQFFYIWNDYSMPNLYLSGQQSLWTVPLGIGQYNALRSVQPNMIQAATLISMFLPMLVYLLTHRVFIEGLWSD